MTVLPKFYPRSEADRRAASERALLRREAQIGGQFFGPVPKGHNRQFFCLDEHTWVWHEEWTEKNGHRRAITTRYDVRPNGVLKLQDGKVYQRLSPQEARNLYRAAKMYYHRIGGEYQRMLQAA